MARSLTPCTSCGTPCSGPRCTAHGGPGGTHALSAAARGYDGTWRRIRAAAIDAWVEAHGWTCPGWRIPAHPVRPGQLTGDHTVALANGGRNTLGNVSVLCRSCNSAKGAR